MLPTGLKLLQGVKDMIGALGKVRCYNIISALSKHKLNYAYNKLFELRLIGSEVVKKVYNQRL